MLFSAKRGRHGVLVLKIQGPPAKCIWHIEKRRVIVNQRFINDFRKGQAYEKRRRHVVVAGMESAPADPAGGRSSTVFFHPRRRSECL